ncbi:ABC-2 type transport system permease protein [Roseinatronobacter monicus]|uniref:ABC-2 type transport system permease protein n=2 Tax=Roseinatronobacter monicus TaxID=393481 RepID=A0A543K3P8_9RHOB|nr:ABC-2 type transport system permease protein [Roseinatronobacter monicus]
MLAVMLREFRMILRRPALLGLVVVLPVVMLLTLAGIFRAGIPTGMAVTVVDLDRSDLSRSITRMLDAAPEITVREQALSLSDARAQIVTGHVRGAVYLPQGLERDILRGARPEIVIFYDNQHMSAGSMVARGARGAIDTAVAGLRLSIRQGQGEASVQAMVSIQPIPLQAHALFNPAFDYVHFLLAALVPTVLQIIAAAATAYAISLDFGPGRHPQVLARMADGVLPAMLGKILPYTVIVLLILGLSDIALYGWLGVPLRGSLLLMATGAVLFVLSTQLIGAAAFVLTRDMGRAASIIAVITAPAFGFMGLGFPREAMSQLAQAWGAVIPGTWYVQLRIDQSLRDTPLDISVWSVVWLGCIVLALGALVLLRLVRLRREIEAKT